MQSESNKNLYSQYNYYNSDGYMYPSYQPYQQQGSFPYYQQPYQPGSSTYDQDSQEVYGSTNDGQQSSYLPPVPLFVPSYSPYVPYYGDMSAQTEYDGNEEYKIPEPKNFETTSSKVDGLITEGDFFEDSYLAQGRVGLSMPSIPSVASYKTALLKKPVVHIHKNGIFGAYCLEDVRCIAELVLQNSALPMKYDCFNYETIEEITTNRDIIRSPSAPCDHLNMYYNNRIMLSRWQEDNLLSYHLHYSSKHNDLLQKRGVKVEATKDWEKFNRIFKENMIFFNPYFIDGKGTTALMNAFFDYARTNLDDNGVVTVMWNPDRKDNLASVKMAKIANRNGFKIVKKLSGAEFANKTGFNHLKNSTSLNRAVSMANRTNSSSKVTIDAKGTDTIIMFKKKKSSSDIPASNIVATAMTTTLSEVDTYVK
jgi:hypothetical protein